MTARDGPYLGDCPKCKFADDEYRRVVGELNYFGEGRVLEPKDYSEHETSSLIVMLVGVIMNRKTDIEFIGKLRKELDRRIPSD